LKNHDFYQPCSKVRSFDCIDNFDLEILCGQYIKIFNPYISLQYLVVNSIATKIFVEQVIVT